MFETSAEFFLAQIKAQRDEGKETTLLGDSAHVATRTHIQPLL
jgi:hypothetical protein